MGKRMIWRALGLLVGIAALAQLGGCSLVPGTSTDKPKTSQSQAARPKGSNQAESKYAGPDLSDAIGGFITAGDFGKYNAVADALSKAQATVFYSFDYKGLDVKRVGDTAYKVILSGATGSAHGRYEQYLQLDISAASQDGDKELNLDTDDGFTKTGPFNKYFTITKVTKLAGYDAVAQVANSGNNGTLTGALDNSTGILGQFYMTNVKPFWQLPKNEELGASHTITSGVQPALDTLMTADSIPDGNAKTQLAKAVAALGQTVMGAVSYQKSARISETYYAVALFKNSADSKPSAVMIFQDANSADTALAQLTYVTAVAGQ